MIEFAKFSREELRRPGRHHRQTKTRSTVRDDTWYGWFAAPYPWTEA